MDESEEDEYPELLRAPIATASDDSPEGLDVPIAAEKLEMGKELAGEEEGAAEDDDELMAEEGLDLVKCID